MGTSSILITVIRYLSEGYDVDYIEGVLGLDDDGVIIGIIKTLRTYNYKERLRNRGETVSVSNLLNLYINGFTYDEIGNLTGYSKEGIRYKLMSEMKKEGRCAKDCRNKNKEMRKSMRDSLFYEEYLRNLDMDKLDEVIENSPYSESSFIKKMKGLR